MCLEHVAREETQLEATLSSLRAVREALLGHEEHALYEALQRQDVTARDAEALRLRRVRLQEEAARVLGVSPAMISLHFLAEGLPPEAAQQLQDARGRLRRGVAEIEQILRNNSSLLYYCLEFLQRFFQDLTGHPRDGRYGPEGPLPNTACGSLIDARG